METTGMDLHAPVVKQESQEIHPNRSDLGATNVSGKDGREEVSGDSERDKKKKDRKDRKDRKERSKRDEKDESAGKEATTRDIVKEETDRPRERERERDGPREDREKDNKGSSQKRSRSRSNSPRHKSSRDRHRSRRSRSSSRSPPRRRSRRSRSRSRSPVVERKKRSAWDKAPPGYEGMNVAQVASINPAVLMPLIAPPTTQQTRQSRRLYVGNLPPGAVDVELMEFFNTALIAAKITATPGNPIVSCQINYEKNFAFLEFRSVEETNSGMAFDGITLHGHSLKVRRPKDYVAPSSPVVTPTPAAVASPGLGAGGIGSPVAIPGIVSTNVADTPNKVFMGGIPAFLTEDQVKELASSFGQLKSFNLVKDTATGLSKGYAFFEYADERVTDRACQGLNGMQLGDKTIMVQRAYLGARGGGPAIMSTAAAQAAAAATSVTNPILSQLLLGMTLMGPMNPPQPSPVLVLLNMATAEEVSSDSEYQGLVTDVQDECSKFGQVKSVNILRPPQLASPLTKVYVEYTATEEAQKAHTTLGGRKYNGRTVISDYASPDALPASQPPPPPQ